MPEDAFISVGSNVDPETNIPLAVSRLSTVGCVVAVSNVYQNPAIGRSPQPDFLNAAVHIRTTRSPVALRTYLRHIENEFARVRSTDRHGDRTIDLDLCLYAQLVLEENGLRLPHPDIVDRACVAVPLAELAPEMIHPLTDEPLIAIAQRLRTRATLHHRADVVLDTDPG